MKLVFKDLFTVTTVFIHWNLSILNLERCSVYTGWHNKYFPLYLRFCFIQDSVYILDSVYIGFTVFTQTSFEYHHLLCDLGGLKTDFSEHSKKYSYIDLYIKHCKTNKDMIFMGTCRRVLAWHKYILTQCQYLFYFSSG